MNQELVVALATTIAFEDLPAIGAPLAGGFFTGVFQIDGVRRALITAGAAGELQGIWNGSRDMVRGAKHRADGMANTLAMAEAGSELAQAALALRIDGFDDWHIPARDQQEMQYRAFKPTTRKNYADGIDGVNISSLPIGSDYSDEFPAQTVVENFREGGADAFSDDWYWSSTQHAVLPTTAWTQDFDDGGQGCLLKSFARRARAVRSVVIQ